MHIKTLYCFKNHDSKGMERHPRNGFEKSLLDKYGYDNPIAALAYCHECKAVFFFASVTDEDRKNCQCFDCELERIKNKQATIDDAVYSVYPTTTKRLALGLPETGSLNEIQQKQLDNYIPPRRGARYVPKTFDNLAKQPKIDELDDVPF